MQVKFTYIVKTDSGTFTVLHETFSGKFFINTHIVGQVSPIPSTEANILIKQSFQ